MDPAPEPVTYICGACGIENTLKTGDVIQCLDCAAWKNEILSTGGKAAVEAAELFVPNPNTNSRMECQTFLPENENNYFFVDEEALFGMPGLFVNMAEGLLLPPFLPVESEDDWGDEENGNEVSLWSFSV